MRRAICIALLLAFGLAVAASPVAGAKPQPPVVGTVTAVGKTVTIKAGPKAKAVRARVGTKLRLGSTLIMGRGASATLRLKRPARVSKARSLVYVRSVKGARHTTVAERAAKGIVVVITPS